MTVAEYIFQYLSEKGCSTTYMVSGSSSMWLTDALYRNESMQAICTHHEQAAAMAADGYARVHKIPGVCLVTIGPGATNAITGVAQAYFDSSPMFVISGQANSKLLQYAKESGIRQNACQSMLVEPMVAGITKYCKTVMDPDEIVLIMEEAYQSAMSGRKGPVWIDVPVDIQNRTISEQALKEVDVISPMQQEKTGRFQEVEYERLLTMFQESKRPLILAGYGVRSADAVEEFLKIVDRFHIPVVTSRGGIDLIATDHPYYVGRPGGYGDRASHFAIQECDTLFILGSRLSVSTIGYDPSCFAKQAVKVMIDIDEKELERESVPIAYKYQMELKSFLQSFYHCLEESGITSTREREEWVRWCQERKAEYPVVLPEYEKQHPLNSYYVTSVLSTLAPENTNIMVDTGSVYCMASQSWKIKQGQRYLASGGFSSMGSWATALGMAEQGRLVLALAGDGSTQMNIQELATLQYNRIPVKLFIYNNQGYMLIRHNQHNYMQDRFLGVGPDSGVQTPDFCAVAKAYGIHAVRITEKQELERKLREVLAYEGPVVCEIMVQEFAEIIPKIASKVMPDGSLKACDFADLYPFLEDTL